MSEEINYPDGTLTPYGIECRKKELENKLKELKKQSVNERLDDNVSPRDFLKNEFLRDDLKEELEENNDCLGRRPIVLQNEKAINFPTLSEVKKFIEENEELIGFDHNAKLFAINLYLWIKSR